MTFGRLLRTNGEGKIKKRIIEFPFLFHGRLGDEAVYIKLPKRVQVNLVDGGSGRKLISPAIVLVIPPPG